MNIQLQRMPTRTLAFAAILCATALLGAPATVSPKGRMVQSHLTVAPTSTFGAASTALLYEKDYWMSSFRGERIIRLVQSEE